MPKSKGRKNVDENFKVAAVQRLQTGGVLANDLAKELGVSIWSLRKWSRQYRKRTAAGAGAAGEPAVPAAAPEELPTKPNTEPPVVDGVGQAAGSAQNCGRDLETTFGCHAGIVLRLITSGAVMCFGFRITVRQILPRRIRTDTGELADAERNALRAYLDEKGFKTAMIDDNLAIAGKLTWQDVFRGENGER